MVKLYNVEDVTNALVEDVAKAESETAWCEAHGIVRSNVSATKRGKIRPGGKIAEAVGFQRILLEAFVRLEDLDKFTPPDGYTLLPYNITGGTSGGRPKEHKRRKTHT